MFMFVYCAGAEGLCNSLVHLYCVQGGLLCAQGLYNYPVPMHCVQSVILGDQGLYNYPVPIYCDEGCTYNTGCSRLVQLSSTHVLCLVQYTGCSGSVHSTPCTVFRVVYWVLRFSPNYHCILCSGWYTGCSGSVQNTTIHILCSGWYTRCSGSV